MLPNRKRWAALDDAIAGLATPDREALVLRSFQGLSYGEMARTLGTDEPAIRKRVSRALTRLGRALRIRGETGDAALLLAGAAGIQATLVVPPGLAEVALAAAGIGASPFLTLTALFSNSTVRIAAALLALASVPALWFVTMRPRKPADAALHARRETASPPPRHDAVMPPTTSNRASTASANAASPTIADSPVRTTSPVPSAAQTAFKIPRPPPRVVPVIVTTRFHRQPRIIAARSSERESSTATTLRGRSDDGVSTPLQQLANLELQPEVAAMFFGDLLEEVLALDPLQRLALTQFLSEQFTRLNAAGLAGPKPAAFAAAVWGAQRGLAIDEMVRGLHDILADSDAASGILRAMLTLSDDSRDEPAARPANPRDNSPAANLSRTLSKASSAAGRDLTPIVISKLPHSP